MKKMLLLGIAAVALVAAAPAQAALSLAGETGIITIPTADTVGPMSLTVAADYVNTDPAMVPIRAEFGVIEGLELGGMYTWVDDDDIDGVFGANAKFVIPVQLLEGLKIAAGANYDMTKTSGDDITDITVYGVGSYKAELEGIMLQASAGVDFLSSDFGDDSESGVGFFAGIEVGIMEGLAVAAEFGSDNGDLEDGTTGLVARYALPMVPGLTVQAGLSEVGDDHEFFVGGQYAFNFGN